MSKPQPSRLSAGELEVLDVLWRHGPVSLSEAHEQWGKPIGYTTIQTRLNRLVDKGIVKKSNDRPACYSAAVSRDQVSQQDLKLLVDRVNDGSFMPLVVHLVGGRKLSSAEIEELKTIVAEAESKAKTSNKIRGKR